MNEYSDSVKSNEVITSYKAITLGKLISLDLSSKLVNRSILKQIDTVKITHSNVEYKPTKYSLYGGMSLIGNKQTFDVSPYCLLNINKINILYSYHILNKEHQVGVAIKIFNSKK